MHSVYREIMLKLLVVCLFIALAVSQDSSDSDSDSGEVVRRKRDGEFVFTLALLAGLSQSMQFVSILTQGCGCSEFE